MPYIINYTDTVNKGTIVVADNTLNSETTLSFPGRGTTAYGQAVNENFLHILENFANTSHQTKPLKDSLVGFNKFKIKSL